MCKQTWLRRAPRGRALDTVPQPRPRAGLTDRPLQLSFPLRGNVWAELRWPCDLHLAAAGLCSRGLTRRSKSGGKEEKGKSHVCRAQDGGERAGLEGTSCPLAPEIPRPDGDVQPGWARGKPQAVCTSAACRRVAGNAPALQPPPEQQM